MRPRVPALNLRVPSLKVAAALVLMMLSFGVLIGEAARTSVQDKLVASAREHVKLILPRASTPAPSGAGAAAQAGETGVEAPESSEPTQTPRPARRGPSHARTPAPSKGKGKGGEAGKTPAGRQPDGTLRKVKHVFVVMLSEQPYAAVFGPESAARYLTGKLEPKGALLPRFDGVAHEGLADELALLSGQGATVETAADCPDYAAIAPTGVGADEQLLGSGCVYPASTPTLPGQLSAKHLSWRAYIGGIDEPGASAGACAHPALGSADPSSSVGAGTGPYSTWINPVVYFASLAGSPACQSDDVGLSSLKHDLARPARTPSLSYIAPSRCEDGNPTPCAPGAAAGLAPANTLLERIVPEILASKAYKQSGLLIITVDQAPSTGPFGESSSCCGQPPFPNLPAAQSLTATGRPRGGGAVGALLLSPFIKGPETSQEAFNDFSLLATIEELFGLKRLGYAALPAARPIEAALFSEVAP